MGKITPDEAQENANPNKPFSPTAATYHNKLIRFIPSNEKTTFLKQYIKNAYSFFSELPLSLFETLSYAFFSLPFPNLLPLHTRSVRKLTHSIKSSEYRLFPDGYHVKDGRTIPIMGYDSDFDPDSLKHTLKHFQRKFPLDKIYDQQECYGYLERYDISEQTKIFTRADLHGDLKSLIANLDALQDLKFLDKHYRITRHSDGSPTIKLVFLGDYVDRGHDSLKIIQILAELKIANPTDVILIRGNHEDMAVSSDYMNEDEQIFIADDPHLERALSQFYKTLPLAAYIGQQSDKGKRQYVQFSHGLFDPTRDIAPLLESRSPRSILPLQKTSREEFSPRIQEMRPRKPTEKEIGELNTFLQMHSPSDSTIAGICTILSVSKETDIKTLRKKVKCVLAHIRVEDFLIKTPPHCSPDKQTMYAWGDVSCGKDHVSPRGIALSTETIKAFFRLISTENASIKVLVRGHQHIYRIYDLKESYSHTKHGIVHTLSAGGDNLIYKSQHGGKDRSYILTPAPAVKDWTMCLMTRDMGTDMTTREKETHFYGFDRTV